MLKWKWPLCIYPRCSQNHIPIQSLLCYSACLIRNSLYSKEFYLVGKLNGRYLRVWGGWGFASTSMGVLCLGWHRFRFGNCLIRQSHSRPLPERQNRSDENSIQGLLFSSQLSNKPFFLFPMTISLRILKPCNVSRNSNAKVNSGTIGEKKHREFCHAYFMNFAGS